MAARVSKVLPFLLVTILVVLGVELFYWVLERTLDREPITTGQVAGPAPAKSTVPGAAKTAVQDQPLDHRVIVERNLFGTLPAAASAPVKSAAEQLAELQATSLELVLMGTIDGIDTASRAIILDKKTRKQEIYKVGDTLQGATIKEIHRGKLVLTANGRDEVLDMSEAAKYRQQPQPVAVNPSDRQGGTVAIPGQVTGDGEGVARPRVVRPTRRIVRPMARQPADALEPATQDEQEEYDEELAEEETPEETGEGVESDEEQVGEDEQNQN